MASESKHIRDVSLQFLCLLFFSLRKIFDQDQTLTVMNEMIDKFNHKLMAIQRDRLPIHVGGNFVDIFIVTLNQELNILKQYEDGEDNLTAKVNAHQKLVHDLQVSIH